MNASSPLRYTAQVLEHLKASRCETLVYAFPSRERDEVRAFLSESIIHAFEREMPPAAAARRVLSLLENALLDGNVINKVSA